MSTISSIWKIIHIVNTLNHRGKALGAEIAGLSFVVELDFLNGRQKFGRTEALLIAAL